MKPSELLSKLDMFADDLYLSGEEFEGSELQSQKLREAKSIDRYYADESLYRNIKKHGVQTPIVLKPTNRQGMFELGNGHHRLAVAHDLEKKGHDIVVPVIYGDNKFEDEVYSRLLPKNENARKFD
jgi:ParB-like chromosome segregation protein Spo0J